MLKPRITIQELKNKNSERLKNSKRKSLVKATNKKRLEKLKTRYKDFEKYTKQKSKLETRNKKLYRETKEKIKGKSKKQIENIWQNYNNKKQNNFEKFQDNIKLSFSKYHERLTNKKGVTYEPKHIFSDDKKYVTESFVELSPINENTSEIFNNLIQTEIDNDTQNKIKYFVIIFVSNDDRYISDVIAPVTFEQMYNINNEVYETILMQVPTTHKKSSVDFEMEKIIIRIIKEK